MERTIHRGREQPLAEGVATGAACELNRREHENLARANEKIIEVLKRDRIQAEGRRAKWT